MTMVGTVVVDRSATSCRACWAEATSPSAFHEDSRCVVTTRTVVPAMAMSAQAYPRSILKTTGATA